jgi:hypothetical protein
MHCVKEHCVHINLCHLSMQIAMTAAQQVHSCTYMHSIHSKYNIGSPLRLVLKSLSYSYAVSNMCSIVICGTVSLDNSISDMLSEVSVL